MPKSTIFLPDVNVWLALASRRHIHSEFCSRWFKTVESGAVVFCRISQMGLLRLLTTEAAMGSDVLSSRDAWRAYGVMLTDERIAFAYEPTEMEGEWKKLTAHSRPTPKLFTDAYLAAFARSGGMRLVTLDRAVLSIASEALVLI